LLAGYLGISFDANVLGPIVKGVANDPIGNGLLLSTAATSQISKDGLLVNGDGQVIMNYGSTTPLGIAGVRIENGTSGWKCVYLGFGFESIVNTAGLRDTLLTRIFKWFDTVTGIDQPGGNDADYLAYSFELGLNYPNPFNAGTQISYAVGTPSRVELSVYNILGQKVRVLVDQVQNQGRYKINWDGRDQSGRDVPSGVYIYQIQTEDWVQSRKMLLVK